jgi:hypothetical protein
MAIVAALVIAGLGWALWTRKIRPQQLPPIILSIAGAFLTIKGTFLPGIAAIGIAVAWYRGLTWRLFGVKGQRSEQYDIDKARLLLGVGIRDNADHIRARHRKLIADNHPDTGGNEDRARALNMARDLLLSTLTQKP